MSRRKQARPRALKRDDVGEFDEETASEPNHNAPTVVSPSGSNRTHGDSLISDGLEMHVKTEEGENEEEEETFRPQEVIFPSENYRCQSCGLSFDTLRSFMDHRNYECRAGMVETVAIVPSPLGEPLATPVTMETDNSESGLNGGIGTPSSWRSSDTPDDQSLSLSPLSCATPSDPDADLTYTIGVTENTPYPCQFCDKAFPRLSYLKRHEQVHSDQMPFKCDYCQRLFKHKRSRDRHIKLHTGDKKYRCPHCESAFSRSDHLKIHMKTHDNAKPFQCTVCNRGYNTAAALTSHMQNHKREPPTTSTSPLPTQQSFRCLQCSSSFATSRDLQAHVGTHREASSSPADRSIQCALCPQFCTGPDALRQHVEQVHPLEAQGKCALCPETFPSLEMLKLHRKMHESLSLEDSKPSVPRLACAFCSKNDFSSFETLQLHIRAMHVPLTSTPKTPVTPSEMLLGVPLNLHSPPQLPPLELLPPPPVSSSSSSSGSTGIDCDYCTMKFSSVHALQKHTLTVHSFTDVISKGKENVYCSQCTVGFSSTAALADHVKLVHENASNRGASPKPGTTLNFKDFAPSRKSPSNGVSSRCKTTSSRQNRPPSSSEQQQQQQLTPPVINGSSPQFTHPGTLLCSQCNAALPDFESFRNHLKTHLDAVVQKYSCSECEGEFATEEQLDAHVATHYLATTTEYGCQCCLKLFSKPDELQKHLMDIHAHHLYRCSLCKEMFDSKVSIQVHFAVKHSNECRVFKCTSCGAILRTEIEFQIHVKMAHLCKIQPFRCLLCDQCFSSEIQLQLHLGTHKKQFACLLCEEAFHVEFLLERHIQTRHPGEVAVMPTSSDVTVMPSPSNEVAQNLSMKSRPSSEGQPEVANEFRCDICDSSFQSESSLSAHRRQAHNIRTSGSQKAGQTTLSLFCAYCNESCKSRSELENHMKAHTGNPSKHKCNICDEVCPSASTLAEHKLTHCKVVSGSTCVTCKVTLKSEEQFYSHVQQHNNHGLPLPCVVCRQTLMSEVEIQMHAKFHLKNCEPQFPCCVCMRQMEASNLIITGKQDGGHTYMCKECFHSKGEDLHCSECKVKFENAAELEKHRMTHKKTYQCIKCQLSFETEAEIQLHVTTHVLQEGTKHECRLCHKVLDSPAKLQCHLIEHNFEGCSNYTCYICSLVFTAPHLIQQHMLEHGLNARPYDCSHCHQRFFFRSELENHLFVHGEAFHLIDTNGGGSSGELQCPDCSKVFTSPINLNNHRKIHELKNSPLKCSACPQVFHSSADMQQHYFQCHGDKEMQEDRKYFSCTECEKVFPCMSNLQGHMRIHTQGTKYTCPECNKEFALSRNLTIHMRSHSGERPYECPICKKRFARKENRKAHLKSHAGLKPFMCPHCGKTFSRKCHVKEHMRIHITSTTHPCEMCTETFPSTRQLRRHLAEIHQKHFDHVCSVCGDVFEQAKHLDHHMQKSHDVLTVPVSESSPGDPHSGSSPGQSSTSGDMKDLDSSECSSIMEDESRDSPVSISAEETVAPPQEVTA